MIAAGLIISHIRQLLPAGPALGASSDQAVAPVVADGAIASRAGEIIFVGSSDDLDRTVEAAAGARRIDANGLSIVPGFVDPHTHAVFAGDRREELRKRLAGATYAEIAASGGGIVSTVAATRAATEDALVDETRARLDEMLACGTDGRDQKAATG